MPRPYPETITPEELAKQAHVSDAAIAHDIAETEQEIIDLTQCEIAWKLLARHELNTGKRTIYQLKADTAPTERSERLAFVAYLKRLQEARK